MKAKINTRIFVVEDDPMYQRMVKYIMEMNPDHEVHVFDSGKRMYPTTTSTTRYYFLRLYVARYEWRGSIARD